MRKGDNPNRDKKSIKHNYQHRILIPIYIPNLEAYYRDSFKIFKLCIHSLLKSINKQTVITVINNGSCSEVLNYLNELFENSLIDEVINTQKVGKLNAILKGLKSSNEPFVTITDADVLFKNNWQIETFRVFNAFKKTAVVGLVPQFKLYESFSHNVIFDNLFSKNLKYSLVKDKDGLINFYKSIGWNNDYNLDYLKYNLSIKKNNTTALVGSGHFVATYKRNIFDTNLPFTDFLLGGTSESLYLDLPPAQKNLWSLTTEGNYAFHMGNTIENWMIDYEKNMLNSKNEEINYPRINNKFIENKPFHYFFKQRLFARVFSKNWFKMIFFSAKGLPKNVAKKY